MYLLLAYTGTLGQTRLPIQDVAAIGSSKAVVTTLHAQMIEAYMPLYLMIIDSTSRLELAVVYAIVFEEDG